MPKIYSIVLSFLLTLFSLSSCTALKKRAIKSYLKKTEEDLKAVPFQLKAPLYPYLKQKHDVLDAFWLHKEKGSSISYFSSCSPILRSLKAFQTSSYPSDLKYKVLKRLKKKDSFYSVLGIQQRDSEGDSGSQGNDTQQEFQTYIAVYTLKKKDCLFNINLLAPSKKIFQEEEAVFQDFIQGFNSLR